MRSNVIALAVLSQVGNVLAFPATAEMLIKGLEERQQQKGGFPEPSTRFNAKFQHVSVSGKHKFVAPDFAKGDQRGPCPGLNAMANHGYLPHNGIGGADDFRQGTFDAFGMGADLATVLTTAGQVLDGDGLRWSIGGPSKSLPAQLGGILGAPQGISGSHNKYEGDASPVRGDLFEYGNDYKVQLSQFKELYDMGQARGNQYSLETLREFRAKRFNQQIARNKYFFNGPFTGVLVQSAAYEFIYRFMSNKSEEHPHGLLEGDVLMSFFGVTKDKDGNFEHKEGHEKFPYNWYKRAHDDAYTQTRLNEDTVVAALANPLFLSVGGNTGTTNSFKGVDLEALTGGVFSSADLLKGNNLACFAFAFELQATPDLIKCSKVLGKANAGLEKLEAVLGPLMEKLACPKEMNIDISQFKQFPGYKELNCKTGKYENP